MDNALFLQSEIADPYALYARMLARHPLRRDTQNNIWAVYSYAACRTLLDSDAVGIPALPEASLAALDPQTTALARLLVRLSNPPLHASLKQLALQLHALRRPVDIPALLERLLPAAAEFDWVEAVCKKLPALALLDGFGFPQNEIATVLPEVERLAKIMLPHRTAQQAAELDAAVRCVLPLVEQRLHAALGDSEHLPALAANLIGLLVQSHDAGRGLLCNTLLQHLQHGAGMRKPEDFRRTAIETLRFDAPIHNTRRVALRDMTLEGCHIAQGDILLLVLAAANRDPAHFVDPMRFDVRRGNNDAHLSFGSGPHLCVAKHFSIQLAAEVMTHMTTRHPCLRLTGQARAWEPMVNARLVRELRISLL
jgi:cytochrome P450